MIYFLDTNICIYYIKGKFSENINKHLRKIKISNIKIPSVVVAELYYGAEKSSMPEKSKSVFDSFLANFEIVDFDNKAALKYGKIRADLERNGMPIGNNDLEIAATALANKATLVTHNTSEFSRIAELKIDDWTL